MASEEKKKDKAATQKKPADQKPDKPKEKDKKPKKAEAEAAPAEEAKKPEPAKPRPPADPRVKYFKKFHGKFLPRGPLRDRHKVIVSRWNSSEDHGGVTVDELKTLLADWRKTREKPVKAH